MGSSATEQAVIVEVDDLNEAETIFDTVCRRELGMSGAEFLAGWDSHHYDTVDLDDVEGLAEVVASLSLVR